MKIKNVRRQKVTAPKERKEETRNTNQKCMPIRRSSSFRLRLPTSCRNLVQLLSRSSQSTICASRKSQLLPSFLQASSERRHISRYILWARACAAALSPTRYGSSSGEKGAVGISAGKLEDGVALEDACDGPEIVVIAFASVVVAVEASNVVEAEAVGGASEVKAEKSGEADALLARRAATFCNCRAFGLL